MEFRVQTGSIAALRALRSDLEKTLVEVCRNHHEVVEAAPARLRNEEQDFRLVHYFTFTPWLVYYEYHTLKGELEGERKNFENLIAFFEGIGKGESEIAGVKQQFAKNWVDGPTRHQFNECRRAFYAARQTIMLEAKTAFGSSDLVISLHNATGFADAMDYESGIDPYAGTLIDAPLRSGVLIALEEIEHWLRGGVGNDTAVPKSELIPPRKAYTKIDQSSTGSSTNIQKNSLDLPDDEQNKNELIDSRLTMEKALKLAKNKSYMNFSFR